jgi:hypothetical protein
VLTTPDNQPHTARFAELAEDYLLEQSPAPFTGHRKVPFFIDLGQAERRGVMGEYLQCIELRYRHK